jgi:hypothetical protein
LVKPLHSIVFVVSTRRNKKFILAAGSWPDFDALHYHLHLKFTFFRGPCGIINHTDDIGKYAYIYIYVLYIEECIWFYIQYILCSMLVPYCTIVPCGLEIPFVASHFSPFWHEWDKTNLLHTVLLLELSGCVSASASLSSNSVAPVAVLASETELVMRIAIICKS